MPLDEHDTARLAALRRTAFSRDGSPADLAELRELESRAAEIEPARPETVPVVAQEPVTTPPAPAPASHTHGVAPLALLDTPRTQVDVPPVALDGDITANSVHLLKSVQTRGVSVYGARTGAGLICLAAVTSGLETAESCATRPDFERDGIWLRITTNHLVQNDRVPNSQAYWEYRWTGDGQISVESNVSPFGSAP